MTRNLLLGSLVAAVAMFVWGFLFWTTPLGRMTISHGVRGDVAQRALSTAFVEEGVYVVPDMDGAEEAESWAAQHRRGPIATVFFRPGGAEPMAPSTFLSGFLHMWATCLLLALLLNRVGFALPSVAAKVGFVALAGFTATFWGQLSGPIWFFHPWPYHLMSVVYDFVAWLLAGIVLARSLRT